MLGSRAPGQTRRVGRSAEYPLHSAHLRCGPRKQCRHRHPRRLRSLPSLRNLRSALEHSSSKVRRRPRQFEQTRSAAAAPWLQCATTCRDEAQQVRRRRMRHEARGRPIGRVTLRVIGRRGALRLVAKHQHLVQSQRDIFEDAAKRCDEKHMPIIGGIGRRRFGRRWRDFVLGGCASGQHPYGSSRMAQRACSRAPLIQAPVD